MSSDQEEKLKLAISSIEKNCNESSPHEDLRTIHAALQNGKKLAGKVVSSGATNYSFQIYFEDDPTGVRLFAKVCFSYALWSGESKLHYDLARTKTEYELMEHFAKNNVPIATPYLLLDVEDMRILVTQWVEAEALFGVQFIEGQVDIRVIPKLAKAFATVNLSQDFDRSLNQGMKEGLTNLIDGMLSAVPKIFDKSDPNRRKDDKCTAQLDRLGAERVDAIFAALRKADSQKDCLVHTDSHVFNILVESKPQPNGDDNKFGKNGSFYLIDWEMTHYSAKGRDFGMLYQFPVAAALFHAAQGHTNANIIDCLREYWQVYAQALKEDGNKSDEDLKETFRSGMGFCGLFLFMLHWLTGLMSGHIPKDGLSEEDIQEVMGSIGETGLKFLEWSFMDDVEETKLDLDGFVRLFFDTIEQSMTALSSSGSKS